MNLKKYLRQKKIRYRTFAEELGVAEQSLKNIVACSRRPGLILALKIEKLTNGQITPQQMVEDFEAAQQIKIKNRKSSLCR